MYDPHISYLQVKEAESLACKGDPGFKVKQRSIGEIQAFIEQLDSALLPDKSNLKRKLSKEEQRFIRSERILCKWNFQYWQSRYHFIRRWDETYGRMQPNMAQLAFQNILAEHERLQIAAMLQALKARQLGITTESEAVVEHRVLFHSNVWATVASANPEKSKLMMNMILDSYEMHPWWLRPERTGNSIGEYMEFRGMRNLISIQHGSKKKHGIARGGTPTVVHLSEVSEFNEPEEAIDASLLFAIHPTATTYVVLESTSNAVGDWWHNTWENSKAHWGDAYSPSMLRPIFFPWYIGRDIYPTDAWMKAHPIPSNWIPSSLATQHADRACEYVEQTPLLSKVLGYNWQMPKEQIWWWEVTREDYRRRKDKNGGSLLGKFLKEACATDTESFQSQYSTVFDSETIELYSNSLQSPLAAYVLDGPEDEIRFELKPEARELNPNIPPISIDNGRYEWKPVKLDGYPNNFSFDNKLLIWEWPENGFTYGLGVDTAKGVGQDSSVGEGLRKATADKVPRQILEWASNRISSADLHPWIHSIAKLMCVQRDDMWCQPKLAIDTGNGGDSTQNALRKMGWTNFHIHMRPQNKVIDEDRIHTIGFEMTEWSRDILTGSLIKALKDHLLDIDSPELVKELRSIERNVEKNRFDHASGCHDDRFMALGMILTSFYMNDWSGLFSLFGKSKMALLSEQSEKEENWMQQPSPNQQITIESELSIPEEWSHQFSHQIYNTSGDFKC